MKRVVLVLVVLMAAAFVPAAHAQNPPPHGVLLNWNWVQGTGGAATGFNVKRATVSGGPYSTIKNVADPAARQYDDVEGATNPLVEGTKYFYVLTTTGNGGTESANSNETNATIPFRATVPATGLSATPR